MSRSGRTTARRVWLGQLIALLASIDAMLQQQAKADAAYFGAICGRVLEETEKSRIHTEVLAAYRWQYIASGLREPRFGDMLAGMLNERQQQRIFDALTPMIQKNLQ